MKQGLIRKLAIGICVTVFTLANFQFAHGEASNFPQQANTTSTYNHVEVERFLSKYGVTRETQASLFEKLEKGEIWDSMRGVEAVNEVRINRLETLSTYPDGSVAVFSIYDGTEGLGATPPSMALQSVSECSFSGSHYAMYWKNCLAKWSYGTTSYTLRFNYRHDQGSWGISDYWKPLYRSFDGSITNTNIVRYSDTLVTYYADYSGNHGGSHRVKNNLRVHKSQAWTENG